MVCLINFKHWSQTNVVCTDQAVNFGLVWQVWLLHGWVSIKNWPSMWVQNLWFASIATVSALGYFFYASTPATRMFWCCTAGAVRMGLMADYRFKSDSTHMCVKEFLASSILFPGKPKAALESTWMFSLCSLTAAVIPHLFVLPY